MSVGRIIAWQEVFQAKCLLRGASKWNRHFRICGAFAISGQFDPGGLDVPTDPVFIRNRLARAWSPDVDRTLLCGHTRARVMVSAM
jgi:hypothetical protein